MTKIARRERKAPEVELDTLLVEFREHKKMAAAITQRVDTVKARLMGILERKGKPDEKGSLWLEFDPPVAGYDAIKREKRVKVFLVPERAEQILQDRGLYEECLEHDITIEAEHFDEVIAVLKAAGIYDKVVTTTERLSDDRIMQLFFAEKEKDEPRLTEKDVESMFREEVTWAFVPRDAK